MTSEEQKIIDIKVKYEDAIYGIIRFQEKLNDLTKTQKQLDEQLEKGEISWNEWATQSEAATAATKQYKENIRVLRKEMQNNLKTEQEQEGSLKQLRAQLSNATKAFDELSRAERQGAKGKELQKHINEITQELKEAEQETQRYYRNVGNYYNSMLDALADVQNSQFMKIDYGPLDDAIGMTVELGQAAEGAGTKIKAFGKSLMALMTNPVFLTIAGIVGAGMAFKFWYDYNKGIMEATRLTQQFTGLTGNEMKSVRNEVLALSDTFGLDFKEVMQSANSMSKAFGISVSESLKIMQDGLVSGANANGEFLDTIKEYPRYFKEAGLNAEEMVAISTQATKEGIFSDKGVDTIKEANIRLREMTTATAAALDAIGISSKQVQKDLQDGSKTTFQVMQEVANKLKELPQTSAAVGSAIADIFGGPGEDAGLAYIEMLGDIELDMDKVKAKSVDIAKAQEDELKATKDLQDAMASLFDYTGGGFETMKAQLSTIAKESLTGVIKGVVKLTNYVIGLYNKSTLFRGTIELIAWAFKSLWAVCQWVFGLISNSLKGIGKDARSFLKIMEGIITFDFSKAKEGFSDLISGWGKTFTSQVGTFKKFGADMWKNTRDGWNNSVNGNELKPIEIPEMGASGDTLSPSGTITQTTSKTQPQSKETAKSRTKATTDEEKRAAEERERQEQKLQAAILKVQMDYQIKMMQAKKMYLAGLYESDEAYQKDMSQLQQEEVARMLDVYVQAGAIGEQKALEMQQKLLDLQIQFKSQLEQEAAKMAETWRKEFEAEEQERERQLLDQGVLEEQDNAARLERYKAFLEEKKKAFQDNAMALAEIDKESKDAEEEREKESYEKKKKLLEEDKNNAVDIANQITSGLTNAFAEMFSEGEISFKSFMRSILTTTLDAIEKALLAYQAQILAREIASKSWAGVASAAALSALIAAGFEGAKAAVKSFAVGGYVSGAGTSTSDSIPARLSNGESVMNARATSMFSPLLSAFNQLGGGVPIMVPNNTGTQIGEDFLAAAIAKGFMMCPRPVVSVEEITQLQERVKVIEGRGLS